jgi:hypothetical protein
MCSMWHRRYERMAIVAVVNIQQSMLDHDGHWRWVLRPRLHREKFEFFLTVAFLFVFDN